MWRSLPLRLAFCSLLNRPVKYTARRWAEHPTRVGPWVRLASSASGSRRARTGEEAPPPLASAREEAGVCLHPDKQGVQTSDQFPRIDIVPKRRIGENISAVDKRKFLVNTLFDLKDSKEAVYGTLDAWVAWEQNFPLVSLKQALLVLEKEEQWHRIVQVLKWMLSKGQGTTMGTYEQLIRALEKDNRAEEAHKIWVKKIGDDLHSVPWRVCDLMISIYYRNNMLERLVKLFRGLETYDRKPPCKSIVRKVADAYEMLGLLEEKNRVLEKYSHLFNESPGERTKKSRKVPLKESKKAGKTNWKSWRSLKPSDNGSVDSGPADVEIKGTV